MLFDVIAEADLAAYGYPPWAMAMDYVVGALIMMRVARWMSWRGRWSVGTYEIFWIGVFWPLIASACILGSLCKAAYCVTISGLSGSPLSIIPGLKVRFAPFPLPSQPIWKSVEDD